jgi:hypothetical protein
LGFVHGVKIRQGVEWGGKSRKLFFFATKWSKSLKKQSYHLSKAAHRRDRGLNIRRLGICLRSGINGTQEGWQNPSL